MGKKSGPAAPPPPDPVATAAAQSQYNKDAAITQANLNRIDQQTPQGSVTYDTIGTNSDGTPRYKQTQTYSPEQQALYDQQNQIAQALGGTAEQQIGRVNTTMNTPFNYSGDTPLQTGVAPQDVSRLAPKDYSADAKRVGDAVYGQATSRLDPQFQQQQSDMTSRLAAQGIPVGSDAWQREMDNFSRSRTDAYNQANFSAIQAGGDEQSRLFGLDMSAAGFNNQAGAQAFNQDVQNANLNNNSRQEQIQEQTYLRNLPLNDIAALLGTGGGVQNPEFSPFAQVGVAAPDYMGAQYQTFNAKQGQYQQQQQARSQMLGSIFGLAGSALPLAFSDRRLKENIVRIGALANGLATYAFNYIGQKTRQFGIMAQEALGVVPQAVHFTSSGYLAVDYGKVW